MNHDQSKYTDNLKFMFHYKYNLLNDSFLRIKLFFGSKIYIQISYIKREVVDNIIYKFYNIISTYIPLFKLKL